MSVAERRPSTRPKSRYTRALIIGTGFSGLGMGIALQQQGVDFLILEKADDVGGTWQDNTYPDCACDVPSHLYCSRSSRRRPGASCFRRIEILEYLQGVTDKYGLRAATSASTRAPRAHTGTAPRTAGTCSPIPGEYVAQFLISGAGAAHSRVPDIEGLAEFDGPAFHSAQWDHDVDLTGGRVAVIGTGASAIQIVPGIIDEVANCSSTNAPSRGWCRGNEPFPRWLKTAFSYVPGLRLAVRTGIYWFLEGLGYAMTKRPALLHAVEAVGKWNIRARSRTRTCAVG